MTSIWGPLGWMTLHSMASLYPDEPAQAEKDLMVKWLDFFQTTITCPSCREHFEEALRSYRQKFPGMLTSRRTFMLFTFRVHNTVNHRLHKPLYTSVAECFATLREIVKIRPTRDYRMAYLVHIKKHWKLFQDASGISALKKINEMFKVETNYAASRTNNFEVDIPEDPVVILPTPSIVSMMPTYVQQPPAQPGAQPVRAMPNIRRFQISTGGLRLR